MTNAEEKSMYNFNEFSTIKLVIVHGGETAHADEMRACGIARAFGCTAPIERRDPTFEELQDPDVLVMDVGMHHSPMLNNYDHHQRTKEDEPKCAYALLCEAIGIADIMAALFPWYKDGIMLDAKGPFALAKNKGTSWDKVKGMVATPEEEYLSRQWASDPEERDRYSEDLATKIRTMLQEWVHVGDYISSFAVNCDGKDLIVGDFRNVPDDKRCLQDPWLEMYKPQAFVFNDNRGPGLGILRVSDCPDLDFARCAGMDGVGFASPDGFIVKIVSKDVELAKACIQKAYIG